MSRKSVTFDPLITLISFLKLEQDPEAEKLAKQVTKLSAEIERKNSTGTLTPEDDEKIEKLYKEILLPETTVLSVTTMTEEAYKMRENLIKKMTKWFEEEEKKKINEALRSSSSKSSSFNSGPSTVGGSFKKSRKLRKSRKYKKSKKAKKSRKSRKSRK